MQTPDNLETAFHERMYQVYEQARTECGYVPTLFLNMVNNLGGLQAAKQLLSADGHSYGLTKLWEAQRLDISMEATILQEPWRNLFTKEELSIAEKRLEELGYFKT